MVESMNDAGFYILVFGTLLMAAACVGAMVYV